MVESWGRCLAFGAFPECVSQNHGAKILVTDVQQGLIILSYTMSEISDVHQRSRSPVEMTARLWHDQYDGLSVISEAFHDSNSLDGNLKEGDMVQRRPKLVFSHPPIPWVGLTDDSLLHLMKRWRVERAKLLIATRDSKGLPGNRFEKMQ